MSTSKTNAKIGIIGGTGIYDSGLLKDKEEIKVYTPYGSPSDLLTVGKFKGVKIAFLPRHGRNHQIPPHNINYRANIWALKELGIERILAPSAVGSLREEHSPGNIIIPEQFIDRTKSRLSTFYDGGQVAHVSTADPFCNDLRKTTIKVGNDLNLKPIDGGVYVCIEGPRFSTRAESKLYRQWGADIIGMTLFPECVLAREAQICYVSISTITDYDAWSEKPVSVEEVTQTLEKNIDKTKAILAKVISDISVERNCECKDALKSSIF